MIVSEMFLQPSSLLLQDNGPMHSLAATMLSNAPLPPGAIYLYVFEW